MTKMNRPSKSRKRRRRKLLVIAYNFPPQLSGVRRTIKFIKHLAPLGWRSYVVTVKRVRTEREDLSPLDEVRGKCRVVRTGSLDPFRVAWLWRHGLTWTNTDKHGQNEIAANEGGGRASARARSFMRWLRHWVYTVDDRVGWLPFAIWRAWRVARRERPEWMLTTSLPNTSHLVGLTLKRLCPHIRWVADFRDGWTLSRHYFAPPTALHRWLNEWLERRVAEQCDLLVTVSAPLTDHFRKLLGGQDSPAAEKCHTITNGFDPEDFEALPPAPPQSPGEIFTLVYTGSFFGSRSPEALLEGIRLFLDDHPEAAKAADDRRSSFRAEFYTQWDAKWRNSMERRGLGHIIELRDFVPYRESLAAQSRASALLLLVPARPHEPIMMTQKVFEYLAARRPILCLAPEDVAVTSLLRETGGAVFAAPNDPRAIAGALGELWRAHQAGRLGEIQPRGIERFSRVFLAHRLNNLIVESGLSPKSRKLS